MYCVWTIFPFVDNGLELLRIPGGIGLVRLCQEPFPAGTILVISCKVRMDSLGSFSEEILEVL